jgi:hypothetical protein
MLIQKSLFMGEKSYPRKNDRYRGYILSEKKQKTHFIWIFFYRIKREPSKFASVKTASNEIQKTQFGQRQHTRNQNSQFQNSQNS